MRAAGVKACRPLSIMRITEEKSLKHHIDQPIRKAVAGMALLGFKPLMSCCGFNYEGQEEGRKHFKGKPYMYLDARQETMDATQRYLIVNILIDSRWCMGAISNRFPLLDFYANTWTKDHPWADPDCPHNPEMAVLAIHSLNNSISNFIQANEKMVIDRGDVELVDGNETMYKDIPNWQYKPAEPWKINLDIWNAL